MPSRLTFMPGGDEDDVGQTPYQAKLRITEGMLDEAADRALVGVDDDQAYATRKLWAMDPALEVANAFQMSEAEVRDQSNFARVSNIRHVVKHVLTTEEVRTLVDLYGEFDLQFKNEVIHDHALAAAGRALDQRLLEAGVLPGRRYKDIGGSIMIHVERGDVNVVVVKSDHDTKDPVRRVHENLRLRKIASGSVVCAGGEQSKLMAQDILAGGGRYYVDSDARLDETHTFSAIMNHVYDIPMEGIPVIMDSGRIKVLEGAIHFSNDFFELSKGELPNIGARFEIDREHDEFRMGFIGSAAPWYIHKFSDYARYGADQILEGKDSLYAYKVIQRRGDTLFFRVLRIGDGAQPNFRQYYALPGVDVVDVDGFELHEGTLASTGPLRRKTWRFPANTWHTLMRDASVRASRGGLDFQDLVNTYRVAVVPHQLSGVSIAPGTRVDMDLLVPMVVHAGFAAYADMVLFDLEISASMQAIQRQRGLADETTIYKAFSVFLGAIGSVGKFLATPFTALGDLLTRGKRDQLREMLVQWKPVPRIRRIHAANVLDLRSTDKVFIGTNELLMRDYMMDRREQDLLYDVAQDPKLAEEILGVCGAYMTASQGRKLRSVVAESSNGEGAGDVTVTAPPSYATRDKQSALALQGAAAADNTTVVHAAVDPNREQNRTNAIHESIQENRLEAEKIELTCVGYLRQIAYGGSVDHAALARGREKMGQPDAWYVSNGVLTESALGEDPQEFSHGAVCCAKPSDLTGSHIWAVYDEEYEGRDSATGRAVTRRHFVVRDSTYSGWVFVNDSLKVYNGPDALEALDHALDKTVEYDVTLHQGGPGAGKTTQIVAGYNLGDMVVCPVRKSAEDTREKLAEKFPAQPAAYWTTMVRTVDSILVNLLRSRRGQTLLSDLRSKPTVVVHADEAFMTSAGKWHAVFRLLGATSVVAYGDLKQIPHVPRVDAPKLYLRLQPDVWVYHWMVYRCRPEIMAIWASEYDFKLRTPLEKGGVVSRVHSAKGLDLRGDTALLVMYQADKVLLRQRYPKHRWIMTVHESEGKTFDKVVLFNFEMRKRPESDATYLFNKPPYVVVAASRARDSFTYVKKAKEPDLLVKWMERAADPRRVAAVMDTDSAGTTKEMN